MKKLLFSCMLFLIAMMTNAQLAINYPLTVSNGTYSSISGTGTNIAAMAADTYGENITGLPGFTVNGVTYNNARVVSNGSVILYASTAPTSSPSTPLSTAITNGAVVISPLGADLHISSAATTAFYWQVIGNEIIFEWQNYSRYASGGGSDVLNFQARLNTSTGAISFVYGTCTPGSLTSAFQVGWKTNGTTASNWATNINNLMINVTGSPNTCTWENAVTGNAYDSTMYLNTANSGVAPASGLTYTWTPQAAPAPVRTFAAVSAIVADGATLSWTAPTGATQYNVRYRAVGSCSWTNFSGNPVSTNSATLSGLTANTSYQIQVQSSDGTNNAIWSHIPNSAGSGNGYVAAGTFKTALLACTGTPSAGTISGAAVRPTCGGSTPSPSTVTVTGQTADASGITFQWETSTDGNGWANATGTGNATVTYTIPAHTAGQTEYYRLKATCSGSGLSGYSDVLQVTDPAAPTTAATNVSTSALGNTTATVTWTNGNGNRRFVKINTTNSFTDPVNGSGAALTAAAAYSGSGEQIVYDGTGTSVSVTGLSATTTYYVRVYEYQRCGSSAPYTYYYQTATATNNPGSFTTSLYCTPTGAANNSDEILNFTLNNLNNTSAASEGTAGYSNYTTTVAPATLEIGTPYTATLTSGAGTGSHGAAIWIDYDDDGTFASGERVAFIGNTIQPSTTASFPAFTVPNTVATGTHRLRIMYRYNTDGASLDACIASTFSEIEDYAVNITAGNLATNETQVVKSEIKIYPNPFSDVLNISDVDKVKSISIMDTSGKMAKSFDKPEAQLRLSDLNSGMYIVVLNMKDGSKQTIKAIKK